MSPELKNHYHVKQRRMAFYIVKNEINNEENPPEVSAIIGLDKELEAAYYAARRLPFEKNPTLHAGMRVNRSITSNKRDSKKNIIRKNEIHCPNMPSKWKNNIDLVIPKAEFGHFTTVKRKGC